MLSSRDRKYLKAIAHHLNPVVQVGKAGVGENIIEAVKSALEVHELIKVKFVERKDEKEELVPAIVDGSDAELVGIQGHVAILYKEQPDPEKRKIEL